MILFFLASLGTTLWLSFLMSASATLRALTEPFSGNRRHNIQSIQFSYSDRKIVAHDLESDIDGLVDIIKVGELQLSSSSKSLLQQIVTLRYPEGIYEIDFKDLKLPNELQSVPELQVVTKSKRLDEISFSGNITVLVLPNKLLRLESIDYLETDQGPFNLNQDTHRSLLKKINYYLPKTIF
jgi:hypothetical protein